MAIFCKREMMSLVNKLNLKSHSDILVLDAPAGFEKELSVLTGVRISNHLLVATADVTFALLFVTRKAQLEQLSKAVASRMHGDIALWFAYPKGPPIKDASVCSCVQGIREKHASRREHACCAGNKP